MADAAKRQRQEADRLQMQMEDNNRKTMTAMKEEYEQAREEQERRHRVSGSNGKNFLVGGKDIADTAKRKCQGQEGDRLQMQVEDNDSHKS